MFLSRIFWFLMPLTLWMADGDGGAGDPPNPDKTSGDGAGGDTGKKSFTQAELDALFSERAKHASQAAVEKLLKDLGVEKPEDIKAALKKAKDLELAQLSELEKAQKEAADNKAEAETAKKEKAETEAKAAEKLLRAAVLAEASKQGFNDPYDAWLYVDKATIKAKEDDTFEGLDKAIEAVLKAKPYLKKGNGSPGIGTPRGGKSNNQQQGQPAQPARPVVRF